MSLVIALVLLAATVPLVVALMRANELFLLRLEHGEIKQVRGKIDESFLRAIARATEGVQAGELRGVSEDGRIRLYVSDDFTDAQKQELSKAAERWSRSP